MDRFKIIHEVPSSRLVNNGLWEKRRSGHVLGDASGSCNWLVADRREQEPQKSPRQLGTDGRSEACFVHVEFEVSLRQPKWRCQLELNRYV